MPYDPKYDYSHSHTATANSQPKLKLKLTPATTDIIDANLGYPKAIAVHVTGGGRASLTYTPARNDAAITIEVADGWVSDTSVRVVSAISAVGSGTASVYGLFG